jgi:drug/metabolite transporter (DMT)-like permease
VKRDRIINGFDLAVTWVVWGSSYLAVFVVVAPGGFPPMTAGAIRMAVGALVLLAFARTRGSIAIDRAAIAPVAVSGVLGWTVSIGLLLFAETRVSSGYSALVMSAAPLAIVGFEAMRARALPSSGELVGLALGSSGVVMLAWPAFDGTLDPIGVAALLLAALASAAGTLVHRHRVPHGAPLVTAGWEMAAAAIGFAIFAPFERIAEPPRLDAWVALLFLAIGASAIAYASYVRLIERAAPSIATSHAYVNPVVALALGSLFAGERPSLETIGGAALLVAGVAFVLGASQARSRPRSRVRWRRAAG